MSRPGPSATLKTGSLRKGIRCHRIFLFALATCFASTVFREFFAFESYHVEIGTAMDEIQLEPNWAGESGVRVATLSQNNMATQQSHAHYQDGGTELSVHINNSSDNDNTNVLSSCVELMQRDQRFADGSFLTQKSTQISWKMRSDASRELTLPKTCRLKRYTANEAVQCLKKKSILFVGDSITRYQFLGLAYFLEHKRHPERFDSADPCHHFDENGNPTCSKTTNVCTKKLSYVQSGGGRKGHVYNGRMEAKAVSQKKKGSVRMQYITSKEDGRIKLNFAMEVGAGAEPFNGWNLTGCASKKKCRYSSTEYGTYVKKLQRNDFDYKFASITEAFESNGTTFQKQFLEGIDYALYNRGIWGSLTLDNAKKMMASLYRITKGRIGEGQSNNRCFYKSTTQIPAEENLKDDELDSDRINSGELDRWEWGTIRNATYDSGCEYFDAYHLTRELGITPKGTKDQRENTYTDKVHFQPWVYEELNNMLLNILCNEQSNNSRD